MSESFKSFFIVVIVVSECVHRWTFLCVCTQRHEAKGKVENIKNSPETFCSQLASSANGLS